MADTPVEGHRAPKTAASSAVTPTSTLAPPPPAIRSVEHTPPPPSNQTYDGDSLLVEEIRNESQARTSRPLLKRRITRPSFVITLVEGSPVGEYEIQAQIGEGAMGTVYSAVHPVIGKRVAIKVLKPELCANQGSIDRFVREAESVNKIGHPNIVDVFSLGELPDGRAYFVMEWLRGEDLKTRLSKGPMQVQDACDVLDGIARALDAAHAKDIVHRDLKPDNVFLHQIDNGPVMVKLLDFGIAKLVRTGTQQSMDKTNTGDMLGTPKYISPEQARGISVDHRADIYSLGVMAYEMLGGRAPFQGETAMDLVVAHMQEDPPPLSQFARVPKPLESCIMRMLEKDPSKRPPLDEVRQILGDPTRRNTPAPGLRLSAISAAARPPATRWMVLACSLFFTVAVVAVVFALTRGNGGDTAPASPPPTTVPQPVPQPVTQPDPPKVKEPTQPLAAPVKTTEPVPPPPVEVKKPPPPPPPLLVEKPPIPKKQPPPPIEVKKQPPPPPPPKQQPVGGGDDDIMLPGSLKKK